MQAVVYTEYGSPDVLKIQTIAQPTPKADEVLIRIEAVSVNSADVRLLTAKPFLVRLEMGLRRPVKCPILGSDVAGYVEAVGQNVTHFKVGEAVFGNTFSFGGGFAEYVAVREHVLAHKPEGIPFDVAATLPMAGLTALQGLRDAGEIKAGQKVLINGASGGVGTFAVQLAKHFGAEVTGVCSTGKVAMVRDLGADHVIDYTKDDFTTRGAAYDLILGVNGYHPLRHYKRALRPGGRYVMIGGENAQIFQALLLGKLVFRGGDTSMRILAELKPSRDDLTFLINLVAQGTLTPLIDQHYSLPQVPDAIRYLQTGHPRGKVVIVM
ncbi:MAG: NAD(P)-dependent alcohol dehydrogenase [Anaerolineae bacterium]